MSAVSIYLIVAAFVVGFFTGTVATVVSIKKE